MSRITMRTVLTVAVCAVAVGAQDLVHKAAPQ